MGSIEQLLKKGAEINKSDSTGNTELHYLVLGNHKKCLALLLSKKPKVDCKDTKEKKTPLHYAVKNNYKECVSLLLAHGADIDEKDTWGLTPLDLATKEDMRSILKTHRESFLYKKNKFFKFFGF